jgi:MFS family permease
VPNLLADKYGRFNVFIIMTLFCMVIILGLWLPGRSQGAAIAFAVLFGIGSGACIGLGPVLIMSISPMKEVGLRMGTIFAVAGVGVLTSPPIGGAIAAANEGSYVYPAVFSGVNYFIALITIIYLRGRIAGWKLTTSI